MTARTTPRRVLVAHPGGELYGSDRVMLESAIGFREAGWEVDAILGFDGPLAAELLAAGARVRIHGIPVLRKNLLTPTGLVRFAVESARALPALVRTIRAAKPDAVYVSTLTIPLWIIAARLCRRPVLCHVHEAETGGKAIVRRGLVAPLLLARGLVANSAFSADVASASFSRLAKRIVVVDNAVVGPTIATPPRTFVTDGLTVAYVGRLSPRKGVDLVLDAVIAANAAGERTTLSIIGSTFAGYEWYEEQLRQRAGQSGIEDRIEWIPFAADIWPILGRVDVLVVPSRLPEPFGNTAVEGVLAARPVIAADIGGLPEAVEGYRSAQLVEADSVAGIVDALLRVRTQWPRFAAAAVTDTGLADERHSPARYRAAMARELNALVRV